MNFQYYELLTMAAGDSNGDESGATDPTSLIWWLSSTMFLATLSIGFSPLACSFKQKNIDRMAVYGAGLMVGAALLVIIPEGVMVLIASQIKAPATHDHAAEKTEGSGDGHAHHDHGGANPEALGEASGVSHAAAGMIGQSMTFGFALMIVIDMLMNIKREWQSDNLRKSTGKSIGEENLQDKYFSVDENNYYS